MLSNKTKAQSQQNHAASSRLKSLLKKKKNHRIRDVKDQVPYDNNSDVSISDEITVYEPYQGVFRGYCGNTLKTFAGSKTDCNKCTEWELRRSVDADCINDRGDGITELPVTDMDHVLGKHNQQVFTWKTLSHLDRSHDIEPGERWDFVIEKLEEMAIRRHDEYMKESDSVIVHYDVPITGYITSPHQKLTNDALEILKGKYNGETIRPLTEEEIHRKTNWLHYNGHYYDPSYIYVQNGGSLVKICPTNSKEALRRERAIKEYGDDEDLLDWLDGEEDEMDSKGTEKKQSRLLIHTSYNGGCDDTSTDKKKGSNNKKRGSKKQKYLEIDLRDICDITAIGTMGGYPRYTTTFPSKEHRQHYGGYRWVTVLRQQSELAWTTAYTIEYRDHRDGKWYSYEKSFTANSDVGTEVINKVAIRTRYLRLTVVEYERAKEMRVQVYGRSTRPTNAPRNIIQPTTDNNTERTVRYSLHPALERKYSANHCKRYICCSWCFGYEPVPVSVRRINRKEEIRYHEDEAKKCIQDEETSSMYEWWSPLHEWFDIAYDPDYRFI